MNDWSKMRDWIQKKLQKRNKTDFIIMLLIGVLVLIIAVPTGKRGSAEQIVQKQPQTESASSEKDNERYRTQLERQLEELLGQISGVGKCKVMLMLEDDGRVCLDKDITIDEGKRSESSVIYRQEDGEAPYVVQQKQPKVAGVVVVAEGGGNAGVVTDISNSVMSLFQLEAHKITVVKMSVQEE